MNYTPIDIKVRVDSSIAEKRMKRVTKAAKEMQQALDALRGTNIELNVVTTRTKKWYQFWL